MAVMRAEVSHRRSTTVGVVSLRSAGGHVLGVGGEDVRRPLEQQVGGGCRAASLVAVGVAVRTSAATCARRPRASSPPGATGSIARSPHRRQRTLRRP